MFHKLAIFSTPQTPSLKLTQTPVLPNSNFVPLILLLFSEDVLTTVRDTLHPLAEDWSGVSLEHTATYGVR